MIPLVEVLTRTETFLRGRGIPSPRYEAELLIAFVLGIERLQIYLQHDRPMQEVELARLRPIVCLLYTSPSPRDLSTSRMPSSA